MISLCDFKLLAYGLNDAIRSLATSENVPLVDTWATFVGYEEAYMRGDGLHPTVAGYGVIAQTFFDAIVPRFEIDLRRAGGRLCLCPPESGREAMG